MDIGDIKGGVWCHGAFFISVVLISICIQLKQECIFY